MDIDILRQEVAELEDKDLHKNHYLSMTTIHEKKFLHQIVKYLKPQATLLELGCYGGGSISIMANSNPLVQMHTIDLFSHTGIDKLSIQREYYRICQLLSEFSNVKVHCGNSFVDFNWWTEPVDLLFVDAAHEEPALGRELSHWLPFLRSGSFLLMHDDHVYFPDVQKNVKKLIESNDYHYIDHVDTLSFFIKK